MFISQNFIFRYNNRSIRQNFINNFIDKNLILEISVIMTCYFEFNLFFANLKNISKWKALLKLLFNKLVAPQLPPKCRRRYCRYLSATYAWGFGEDNLSLFDAFFTFFYFVIFLTNLNWKNFEKLLSSLPTSTETPI